MERRAFGRSLDDGAGCSAYDSAVVAASPNGKGIDGCVITQEVPLEFDAAR